LDGTLLEGSLPPRKEKLIIAWNELRRQNLIADWDLVVNGQKVSELNFKINL